MNTCLVVDDSRVIRKVARRILEDLGFEVAEASDGLEALAWCRAVMPQAILLDWHMPVMNGIEFLKELRQEFGPGNPPVLFCTTETEISFIEQAIEHGHATRVRHRLQRKQQNRLCFLRPIVLLR